MKRKIAQITTEIRPDSHGHPERIVADFLLAYPKPKAREIIAWKMQFPYAEREITDAAIGVISGSLTYQEPEPSLHVRAAQGRRIEALMKRAEREIRRGRHRDRGLDL